MTVNTNGGNNRIDHDIENALNDEARGGGGSSYTHRDWKYETGQVLLVVAAAVKALEQMDACLAAVQARQDPPGLGSEVHRHRHRPSTGGPAAGRQHRCPLPARPRGDPGRRRHGRSRPEEDLPPALTRLPLPARPGGPGGGEPRPDLTNEGRRAR